MKQELGRSIKKLLLFCSPLYTYKISGNSMRPTLQTGDVILVNRLTYVFRKPKTGDIVALKDPRDGKILIKRIAKIETNHYFVLGDNPDYSTDSREFGMIGGREIIGRVIFNSKF